MTERWPKSIVGFIVRVCWKTAIVDSSEFKRVVCIYWCESWSSPICQWFWTRKRVR